MLLHLILIIVIIQQLVKWNILKLNSGKDEIRITELNTWIGNRTPSNFAPNFGRTKTDF